MKTIKNNTITRMSAALTAALALSLAVCSGDGGPGATTTPPPATCDVRFEINGAFVTEEDSAFTAAAPNLVTVSYGQALGSLPIDPYETSSAGLFEFAGWYTNADCTGTRVTKDTLITGHTTLYAKWLNKGSKHIITLDLNTDSYSPAPVLTGDYKIAVSKVAGVFGQEPPLPTRGTTGEWRFDGWYTAADKTTGTKLTSATTIVGDSTYYARWIDTVAYNASNTLHNSWNAAGPEISYLRAEAPGSLRLKWDAPLQTGVQSYEILEHTANTAASATAVPEGRITRHGERDVTITGLTNGATRYFWIKTVRYYTKSLVTATGRNATALGQATAAVSARAAGSFTVAWTAVPGADAFDVYLAGNSADFTAATKAGSGNQSGTTYTESSPAPGTTYHVWVVAKNDSGWGANAPLGDATKASASGIPAYPVSDGYAQRTITGIRVVKMPDKRAYNGTLSEFTGVGDIDWAGLTIEVLYAGEDPVPVVYDGVDSRFAISGETFAPVDGSPSSTYTKPAAPGASLALNATVSFDDDGPGAGIAQTTTLNDNGGSLLAPASRYIFVANLPIDTYFKAGQTGDFMVPVSAPAGGYVTTSVSGSHNFAQAATYPVAVSNFKIAKFETTQKLNKDVLDWAENTAYNYARDGNRYTGTLSSYRDGVLHPQDLITWYQALVFCNALSEMTGKQPVYVNAEGAVMRSLASGSHYTVSKAPGANGYRLPTKVEWEYAARGGDQGDVQWAYAYSGSNSPHDVAWFTTTGNTQVGSKDPNRLGLYDMSGNVAEWTDSRVLNDATSTGGHYSVSNVSLNGNWYTASLLHSVQTDGFRLASD